MHQSFADWYRIADLEPKADVLAARWAAVEVLQKQPPARLFDFVRTLFRRSPVEPESVEVLRGAFKESDATFPMRGNDAELAVLSGAVCGAVIQGEPSYVSDALALAIATSAFGHTGVNAVEAEFVQLADAYLGSERVRVRRRQGRQDVGALTTKTTDAIKTACDQNTAQALREPLNSLVALVNKLVDETSASRRDVGLVTEEVDILWWVFGGRSREASGPFEALDGKAAGLVAASELAGLTRYTPGVYSASSLLAKVAGPAASQAGTIPQMVDAVPRPLRENWAKTAAGSPVEDLCPITIAVRRSVESADSSWAGAFEKITGLSRRAKIQHLDVAMEFYRELMLARSAKLALK